MPAPLERVDSAYALVTDPTARRVLLVRDRRSGQSGHCDMFTPVICTRPRRSCLKHIDLRRQV